MVLKMKRWWLRWRSAERLIESATLIAVECARRGLDAETLRAGHERALLRLGYHALGANKIADTFTRGLRAVQPYL